MNVLKNIRWNFFWECLLIAALMGITYGLAAGLLTLRKKETREIET